MKLGRYYNNGEINIRIHDGEQVPEGFVPGMKPRTLEQKEVANAKRRQTNLQKYGTEFPLQSEEIKAHVRQTNLERYGVENPSQSEEIKKKREQTFIDRLGAFSPFSSAEVQKKIQQTNLQRYGAANPFQSEEIKEKIRQSNLQRYGVEHSSQIRAVKEKKKQTTLEHYGVESPMQSEEIQEKARQTNQERRGVDYPTQSVQVRQIMMENNMRKYRVFFPAQLDEVKEKTRQTNQERYGTDSSAQAPEIKEKMRQTCRERYGVDYPCQRPEFSKEAPDSVPNRHFAELLDSYGISYEREFSLGSFRYDFRVGNILIEINPTETHNVIWSPFKGHGGISKEYHRQKSKTANEAGFHCIHIFDWDDTHKIISLLKSRQRVYARKCEVREVLIKECDDYLNIYHIQGTCKRQEVRLGLYFHDELVSLMTFGAPRYNKKFQWELLRYCTTWNVIGGAEKLFKHFLQGFQPESIISYCDYAKFRGDVYVKLGFKVPDRVGMSKHWYSLKEKRHITDNFLRQRGYDQIFGEHYGKGTSNEELMIARGYLPIYDCGQGTYTLRFGGVDGE